MDRLIRTILDKKATLTVLKSTDTVNEAIRIHGLSPVAAAALGRTLTMTSMMGAALKNETDYLSVTIKGGGPVGSIVTAAGKSGNVKGYVDHPEIESALNASGKLDVGKAVGKNGKLTVIKNVGAAAPYVGSSSLVSGEIAEDFAAYFVQSEQKPSAVVLGVLIDPDGTCRSAGGLFLQTLPFCEEEEILKLENAVARTANISKEMEKNTPETFLEKFFTDFEIQTVEQKEIGFLCDCNRGRIDRLLVSLGEKEARRILEEEGKIEFVCHFCNRKYIYREADTEKVFRLARKGK